MSETAEEIGSSKLESKTVQSEEHEPSQEFVDEAYLILNTPTYPRNKDGKPEAWSTEKLLATYVQCTDELIGKMDGSIPIDNQTVYRWNQEKLDFDKETLDHLDPPQSVVYLDKSARPVQWLVREL